jgi:hypothetical protein
LPTTSSPASEHHLIIQLLRDIDSRRERGIAFIWPPAPTVIKPSKLATVTTAIITALLQLRDAKRVWVSCPVQSLCLE